MNTVNDGNAAHHRQFDALFRDNAARVHGFAVARVGRAEAEDVVAEVFHAAVVAFRAGNADQVTAAWLMAVARNKIIDRWRRAERRNAKAHLVRPLREMDFPEDWVDDVRRDAVLDALDQLTPRHRALLVLHHVDGMPAAEIAVAVGDSVRAVESALSRARRAFRKHYTPERTKESRA